MSTVQMVARGRHQPAWPDKASAAASELFSNGGVYVSPGWHTGANLGFQIHYPPAPLLTYTGVGAATNKVHTPFTCTGWMSTKQMTASLERVFW